MTETSIFNQETPDTVTSPAVSSTTIQLPPEVAELVGAGKKYSTEIEALKSVPHAQKHIQTLEQELAQTKQELERRKTAETLIEEIKASGIQQVPTSTQSGLDQNTVQQLIVQALETQKSQEQSQVNTQKVISAFKEKFGEQAETMFIKVATESGLSIQNLNKLAASAPSAVLKLAGVEETKNTSVQKPTGSVNTSAFTNNDQTNLSARVGKDGSTKSLVNAWKNAGQKVKAKLNNN